MSRVRYIFLAAPVLLLLLSVAPPAGAELVNYGPDGEYFYDTATGLYWIDSSLFHGCGRESMDYFATYSATWSWASQSQVEALNGQSSDSGNSLVYVMGPSHTTLAGGGPRWVGVYLDSGVNGLLVQSTADPDFATVTLTGSQANAIGMGAGAWMVATINPAMAAAVLENDGIYFHDTVTDLWWYDPAEFFGMTRADVEIWLTTNTDWRWATQAEVFGLLGKASLDDDPLLGVMGASSTTLTEGGPRWVGYYDQDVTADGLILDSRAGTTFHLLTTGDTQVSASSFNPGAWLVSDNDPTPNEDASWGDVKQNFR